jgi:signal transduction histidine kinase/ligand-binding sensor domain-containing protein
VRGGPPPPAFTAAGKARFRQTLLAFSLVVWGWGAVGAAFVPESEEQASEEYVLRVWETEDGLPHSTISGFAQTPDGYLWLATHGGLARFDGVRFTAFTKWTGGLESSYVHAVSVDRSGALWVGLQYGGVARFRDNRFETIIPLGSPTGATAWTSSFAEDASGAIWIGQAPETVVSRWSRGKLTEFTEKDGLGDGRDTFVYADMAGQIWCHTVSSCAVFDGARFRIIDLKDTGPTPGGDIRMGRAARGGMWVASGIRLLHCLANGDVHEVADLEWLGGSQEVTALFESRTGDLWMGTRAFGLWRFRDGKFIQAPTSRPAVKAVAEDREGNLWVGLLNGGLNRLRPQRFVLHDTRHGLPMEGVRALAKDVEGRIWLAVRDSPPTRSVDATNQSFAPSEPWPGSLITTLCADPKGGVWIGQHADALLRWKDGEYTTTSFNGDIASLLCDREGNVWIATERDGVFRWRDNAAHLESTDDNLKRPRALAEDSTGAIWAGTEEGFVFRREAGHFVPITLPGIKPEDPIRFIVPDGEATVWIGTRSVALLRWQAGRIARLPAEAGLGRSDLRALLIDSKGNFWFARGQGLLHTTRESLDDVLTGRERSIRSVVYTRDDGLPGGGFIFGRRNATAETRNGHLWFATDRGCVEVDPKNRADRVPLLPALVEELRVRSQPVALGKGAALEIPPRPGTIEIRYTLPYFTAPDRLLFRYRLVGMDDAWVEAGNQRTVSFARLPPGQYRFEVGAKESDAPDSGKIMATLPFTIRAAWWETGWFRAGTVALGALALAALVRMIVLRRVRARMRLLEQQHAIEKERMRIARDMHDDLGASLTQITLASQLARLSPPQETTSHLDAIAAIARRTVTSLDEIVWMVNPRNDTLSAAVEYLGQHAVDFLSAADIGCELDIPSELPSSQLPTQARHHLFLVVKETLNNVVKHAGATAVQFKAEVDGHLLRLTIADNGRGFAMGHERAGSDGLLNMQSRLAELGGAARIESTPGVGTRVIFEMPLAQNGG